MAAAGSVTRFKPGQSGNPAGRPPGAFGLARLILPDLPKLVNMLRKKALEDGDIQAARILIDKVIIPLKAEAAPVQIPGLADATTPTAKADAILASVARGDISPTTAGDLLAALANVMKIYETDELQRRIEDLERKQQ
jgi:hypothetical protein